MYQSLEDIIKNNFQWRLEFNFNNEVINFQSIYDNKISMYSTYSLQNYPNNNEYTRYIYTLENYKEIIEIYQEIKNKKWNRIKLKFYAREDRMNQNEINNLKKLIYNFVKEWSEITQELNCNLEWDINSGLYDNFLDDWNECFIFHSQKNIKMLDH